VSDETASKRTMDYDPMIYDALRETANRVAGKYVAWAYRALTAAEDARWMQMVRDVRAEVRDIDTYDESAIRAKTAELTERFRAMSAQEGTQWERLSNDEKALANQISAAYGRGDVDEVARLRALSTVSTEERLDRG